MVDNATMGPVQVFSNDTLSLNQALQELANRIDGLKGLRGRAETFDRMRVDDPSDNQDAQTLGSSGLTSAEERSRRYSLMTSRA